MAQLHKKFSDKQIRDLLARYVEKKIKRVDIQKVLGIGKTRFFAIVKEYKKDSAAFSVEYIIYGDSHKARRHLDSIFKISNPKEAYFLKLLAVKFYSTFNCN